MFLISKEFLFSECLIFTANYYFIAVPHSLLWGVKNLSEVICLFPALSSSCFSSHICFVLVCVQGIPEMCGDPKPSNSIFKKGALKSWWEVSCAWIGPVSEWPSFAPPERTLAVPTSAPILAIRRLQGWLGALSPLHPCTPGSLLSPSEPEVSSWGAEWGGVLLGSLLIPSFNPSPITSLHSETPRPASCLSFRFYSANQFVLSWFLPSTLRFQSFI